ncbi:hypothetical protein EA003_26445, partial [Vibrio anguillarum]|nr:hypothetical protein [Vibrio anguillarum]
SVITVLFIHALLLILIVHCNVGIVLVAVHRFMMLLVALLVLMVSILIQRLVFVKMRLHRRQFARHPSN